MHYDKSTIATIDQRLDQFLAKASKQNEPFQYFSRTNGYSDFKDSVRQAFRAQAEAAAGLIRDVADDPKYFSNDFEPLTTEQLANINGLINQELPRFGQYMSELDTFLYLKTAFLWGIQAQYKRWGLAKHTEPTFRKAKDVTDDILNAHIAGDYAQVRDLINSLPDGDLKTQMTQSFAADIAQANPNTKVPDAGNLRPDHQKALEAAHKAGDYARVKEILDAIPDSDPYKATMQQVFQDDVDQAVRSSASLLHNEGGFAMTNNEGFTLTNDAYIAKLKSQTNYLLNKSNLDDTTRQRLISIIKNGALDGLTTDEIADSITEEFDGISDWRADMIANTETNQAMSQGQLASMTENGVTTKAWVIAGPGGDEICDGNASDGFIPVGEDFSSGDDAPPGHPNCECYLEAGEIDLESVNLWSGE